MFNPRAGGGRSDSGRADRLRRMLGSRGVLFPLERRELVTAICEGLRDRGIGTLAIIGGDGTLSIILSELARVYGERPLPRIALLRGGSMNTIANAVGVRRAPPERLLQRLLSELPTLPTAMRNTLRVHDRIGFLFGGAVLASFLEALYSGDGEQRGRLAALSLLARGSVQAFTGGAVIEQLQRPLEATLSIDGEVHPTRRYLALLAGTVEQVGLGFRPLPQANADAQHFQLLAFHGSAAMLARQLPRIRRGLAIGDGLGFAPAARSLEIDTAGAEFTYMLDGELHRTTGPLMVALGPRIELLLP